MQIAVGGNNGTSHTTQITLTELPDKCPYCHRSIRPVAIYGCKADQIWQVLMNCPDENCRESFIGYYSIGSGNSLFYKKKTSFGNLHAKTFPKEITEISASFSKIYNESYSAEQQGLLEICGVGYRKSLEFLIKDYAILKSPDKQEEIEKKLLGPYINDYVKDEKVKFVVKRAVWLGNDETHYVRKWEGKNLEDLKKLIDLTLHWIEAEVLTESFGIEMPSG